MAAEQGVVERLRIECFAEESCFDCSGAGCDTCNETGLIYTQEAIALQVAGVPALLAVVEAAQDFHRELVGADLDSQQEFHFNVLGSKLAALHTQASDEETR